MAVVYDCELSIVIPAKDEQDNVALLVDEIHQHIVAAGISTEVIFVDDGSKDQTRTRLLELAARHTWVKVLARDQCNGKSAATFAGIAAARGQYVATLDADLQNDPADLPRLLERLKAGECEYVQGRRANRQDTRVKRITSRIGRAVRRFMLGDTIRDTGCATRMMTAEIARGLPLQFEGMHRFMPVSARMLGARLMEVDVNHRNRASGSSKYGVWDRAKVGFADCMAMRWMIKRYRDSDVVDVSGTPKGQR